MTCFIRRCFAIGAVVICLLFAGLLAYTASVKTDHDSHQHYTSEK